MINKPNDTDTILQLLKDAEYQKLSKVLGNLTDYNVRNFLSISTQEQREEFIQNIKFPIEHIEGLNHSIKEEIINLLGTKETVKRLKKCHIDDILRILEDIDTDLCKQISSKLPLQSQIRLKKHLSYPEKSAARLSHDEWISIKSTDSVKQAIAHIENQNINEEYFHGIFVIDKNDCLSGFISLGKLLCSNHHMKISDIIEKNRDIVMINANTDQEEVADIFKKSNIIYAPVVSEDNEILGTISATDVFWVLEEKTQEDMLSMTGLSNGDVNLNLLENIIQRLPWLAIVLFSSCINSFFIDSFDKVLIDVIQLASLMPIIAALMGNIGSQSTAIAVGSLGSRILTSNNSKEFIKNEIKVGISLGVIFSISSYTILSILEYNPALINFFSGYILILSVISTTGGLGIPLLLQYFKVDPAVGSSVIVTGITDLLAFAAFFVDSKVYTFVRKRLI